MFKPQPKSLSLRGPHRRACLGLSCSPDEMCPRVRCRSCPHPSRRSVVATKGERDSDNSDLRLLDSGRRCCHHVHFHVAVLSLTAAPGLPGLRRYYCSTVCGCGETAVVLAWWRLALTVSAITRVYHTVLAYSIPPRLILQIHMPQFLLTLMYNLWPLQRCPCVLQFFSKLAMPHK